MIKKQSGLTMISWMFILALVAIQSIALIRVIPMYMNDSALAKILKDMENTTELRGASKVKIEQTLKKRLKIESLYDLASQKDVFKLKKNPTGFTLTAHYESRGPIYKNLEFVATFDHSVDIVTK